MGDMERWEDMPDVVTAAWGAMGEFATQSEARRALADAVAVEPVVPVRVLRDWIEQERGDADDPSRHPSKRSDRDLTLDALSRVLDDYEKENPNG